MNRKIQIIAVFATVLASLEGVAQNLSNRGRDFWVGYGHHQFMETGSNSQEMVLYLSAEQTANVTVSIEGTAWVRNYSVPAGTVLASDLIPKVAPYDARLITPPCSFAPPGWPCGGEGVFTNKGIHITSDVPIVAYAHIYGSASSGATMLMPVETWGYSYVTLNSKQIYATNCYSWVYAIAQHDNTVIEVTPAATTRAGRPAGVPYTITLNRGEIYQTMAGPETGTTKPEMSGTKIKSIANAAGECYPIAVFAGSSRTRGEPVSCGTATGGDNDNQQCFPSQAWGKRYLTAPTSNSVTASTSMWNTFKVAVRDPATVVTRNGTPLTGLIANSYYEFISNQPELIEADKPVMVAQFIHSGSACFGGGGVGDPEMMYISPVEQGIKRIGFYRNNEENITVNYLTLIIPTNGVASLRIDGSATFDHTYPHPRLAGYSVVVKRWPSAQAQAIAYSDSAFTAITYGLGSVESYGYNAGTMINNLSAFSHIQNTPDPATPQHEFTCTNTPINLSVLMAYQPTRIDWLLSQVPEISPNADYTDNAPVSVGTTLINGVPYYRYVLPGTFTFSVADTINIPIRGYHPSIDQCLNREDLTIQVIVKETPVADFSFLHSGCTLDNAEFTGAATTSNNYTVRDFNWTFPGPTSATGQVVNQLLPPGVHSVRLDVVTADGCIDDTTKTITVYDKPPGDFMITPSSLCVGNSFVLNDTSSANIAVNEWWWDFGNGVTQTVTSGPTVTYTYPVAGTYTIRHVARSSATCVSDTISRTVTVYASPDVSFTHSPAGCLDVTGAVQFTGTASTADGQLITNYSWNFGDPNANPGNPNTSTLQNPTHNFQEGTYNITFSVTSENGCTKDTVETITFNLKPQLAYPALNAICENGGTVSIANGSVTNAVPGTGQYSGPGTDAAGMFDPAAAGPGTHTIWYHFTSNAGCVDSISQTILVHARPRPNFSYPNSGCLPPSGQVDFTNNSTIADGQTMTWLWNFDDPNANAGNPNTSTLQNPSHNYLEGTYNINLQASSSNGCVADTTITATFSLTPALSFAALPAICENAAPVSIASASVTNGATGTGVYSGPGTDAAGMFDPAAAGPGTHTITYTFTTTGGCVTPITQTIQVHGRPRPNFDINGNGCLPTNGQVQFNNTSTIPDGQAMTWSWNFGDPAANPGNPNTSTAQNPTHNYGEGTYSINLQATSANGCVKDTTITATFSLTPLLAYPALAAVCENLAPLSVATASATNAVTGTGVYSGPGTDAAGMFNPAAAGPGTHTITYTYTSTGGCTETITQTIDVHARPMPNFSFTNGCLDPTGLVQFTNTSTIADAQTMSWAWNFNDPNANGSNPNTSSAQDPTHNFGEGTFPVNLLVTSSNGCVKDTTINATFAVTPALAFAAIAPVCQNPGAVPSPVDLASVTNGVSGTGLYSGPGTSANGMFDPNVAGPGVHTITYTFTSTGGCTASITGTITVYPRPNASFTVSNNDACLGDQVTLTSTSTISSGNITTWNWNLGDGNTATYNNGNPFTVNYAGASNYTVQLVAVSDNGCVSEAATQTIGIHPLPVADFALPSGICMPGGNAGFTNQSTVGDNSAMTYQWTFGDGGNSTAANPNYVYGATGTYNVTLISTSAYGCSNQVTKVLDDFYDKPIAFFTTNAQELCQGDDNLFTDGSTAPNSTVQSWNWSFGDNTSSAIQHPTKRFNNPGVYDVKLTVTNAVGCVSDVYTVPVTVHLQPVIDAGISFAVPQGTTVQLTATANAASGLIFQWTPPADLSDATILQPMATANQDRIYTLTATGDFGCTASDFISIKVLKPVKVPNIFTPNGDNIHDRWEIANLADYPGATVEVFNRYGQQVYYSAGYGTPWDGTYNGKAMPVGTYYYVIQLKNGFKPMTGSVTIVR